MERRDPGLRQQATVRSSLRVGGPILFGAGLLLTAIAMIDFFSTFGSFGPPPTQLWMAFVGLPLLVIGLGVIQAGYFGAATRYVAGEVTPTIRDALGAITADERSTCGSCGASNERGARFCSACGRPLAVACPSCATDNEAGARFCNHCGAALPDA